MDRLSIGYVWHGQDAIPVAMRRTGLGEKHRVKLPFFADNRAWLRNGRPTKPAWVEKTARQPGYWEIPKSWFSDFVDRSLVRYGRVYIVQPYREQEICAPACRNARGHECQCSCMGEHHGTGDGSGWFDVSDAFSFRLGQRELACRLLTARKR